MYIEGCRRRLGSAMLLGRTERIRHIAKVVGILPLWVVHLVELPEHSEEVGLPASEEIKDYFPCAPQRCKAEVLTIQHGLGLDQFRVKLPYGKACGQDGVLNIKKSVIERGELTCLSVPGLRPWVWGVDREMDDLRYADSPFPYEAKPFLIPVGIGDDVDGDSQTELASHIQSRQILMSSDAFAMHTQCIFVECFQT